MKIERLPEGKAMLDFWFENGNADLFSGKSLDLMHFGASKTS
ncbi:hypothetical protein [Corallococcus exiguus]